MVYYGNGGFNFHDLYTMPVYLRNFYYKKLIDIKNKEKEAQEQAKNPKQEKLPKNIARPAIPHKTKK